MKEGKGRETLKDCVY